MYYIAITNLNDTEARALGFLTGMKVVYDKRFKKHELRGAKAKHYKYLNVIKEYAKVSKGVVHDWVAKEDQYKSKNQFIVIKG